MEKKEILNEFDEFMFNESSIAPDDIDIEGDEFEADDYDWDDYDDYPEEHYEEFSGTYAQEYGGFSDEDIYDIFDGDPDAYWNID